MDWPQLKGAVFLVGLTKDGKKELERLLCHTVESIAEHSILVLKLLQNEQFDLLCFVGTYCQREAEALCVLRFLCSDQKVCSQLTAIQLRSLVKDQLDI